jgi:hypothetical protein
MTKNINDLLEYCGKLKQQEAKRKPKPHRQDNKVATSQNPESTPPRKPKPMQCKELP